jgi:hypothetical protein
MNEHTSPPQRGVSQTPRGSNPHENMGTVTVIDTVRFVPAAWDVRGPVDVVATLTDGSTVTLFRYFPDEMAFSSADFVGQSVEEARALHHRRDVRWLQS